MTDQIESTDAAGGAVTAEPAEPFTADRLAELLQQHAVELLRAPGVDPLATAALVVDANSPMFAQLRGLCEEHGGAVHSTSPFLIGLAPRARVVALLGDVAPDEAPVFLVVGQSWSVLALPACELSPDAPSPVARLAFDREGAAALLDVDAWLLPAARVMMLRIAAAGGAGKETNPRKLVALFAHRSSPIFSEVRALAEATERNDIAGGIFPRARGDRWLAEVPADALAVVVAAGETVRAVGVPFEALVAGGEVGRG